MKLSLFSLFIICLLFACAENESALDQAVAKTKIADNSATDIDILLFKKEKILQVWRNQSESKQEHLFDCQLLENYNWPIGVFERDSEATSVTAFRFPSDFYAQKLKNRNALEVNKAFPFSIDRTLSKDDLERIQKLAPNGKILIFPNKYDKESGFAACLNCPHWTAEMYARLELELNQYKK